MTTSASPSGGRPIAVIGGTGPAGMGLALRWARAGETIIIGSRDTQRAQKAADAIREKVGNQANISGMENAAACAAADILMLTVPFEGQASLLKQLKPAMTAGSILIDATVPLAASVGGRAALYRRSARLRCHRLQQRFRRGTTNSRTGSQDSRRPRD
jgi:NADPH-dependent F420 reductase